SRRRHTRFSRDWSSDVCSSDLYHIINVTELPETLTYKLATIELELLPGEVTRNEIYRNADFFVSNSSNAKEFRENAEKENYRIRSEERRVGKECRSQWAAYP